MSDRTEFARNVATLAMLLRRLSSPEQSDFRLITASLGLHKLGQSAGGLATRLCNGWVTEDEYDRKRLRIESKAAAAVADLGIADLEICVGGDPRGFCLKLKHKDLPGNSWGGQSEGYGL